MASGLLRSCHLTPTAKQQKIVKIQGETSNNLIRGQKFVISFSGFDQSA
jgi:hypothetical protein